MFSLPSIIISHWTITDSVPVSLPKPWPSDMSDHVTLLKNLQLLPSLLEVKAKSLQWLKAIHNLDTTLICPNRFYMLLSFLTPIQSYWPPCFSLDTPGIFPTQGVCTRSSFYLGHSSPDIYRVHFKFLR